MQEWVFIWDKTMFIFIYNLCILLCYVSYTNSCNENKQKNNCIRFAITTCLNILQYNVQYVNEQRKIFLLVWPCCIWNTVFHTKIDYCISFARICKKKIMRISLHIDINTRKKKRTYSRNIVFCYICSFAVCKR